MFGDLLTWTDVAVGSTFRISLVDKAVLDSSSILGGPKIIAVTTYPDASP